MTGYAVVDVETTGLWPGAHRIVELAVVLVDEDGRVEDEWATLLNPGRDLGPQHVHGIAAADVLDAPTFDEVAPVAADLLAGRAFVAHNAPFDRRFVQQAFWDARLPAPDLGPLSVCTMHWASRLLPVTQRTLAGCCACAGVVLEDAHEALGDARATAGLLSVMVRDAHGAVPWKDALVAASAASWPSLGTARPAAPRVVRRGAGSRHREHFLSRLVATSPPPLGDEAAASYVATLDRALLDRLLSVREQESLVALAEELRIDRAAAERLHRDYLRDLARRAWADGVITADERADLDAVAVLLGLDDADVADALASARDESSGVAEASAASAGFTLSAGDLVVFTGDMALPRSEWERRASAAGLLPHGNVTKRVALVVAADPDSLSGKARKAAAYGIPIVTESCFADLLAAMG